MRIASIDQGTTSTRCLVVEDGGEWKIVASRKHGQDHPFAGWVEHDPHELLKNILAVLDAAGKVDAVAIANQGESCIAWDAETKEALSSVIVWQDARTAKYLADLGPEAEETSKRICGLPLDPYFSASKLAWLIRHVPHIAEAQKAGRLRLGTTDAFFLDSLADVFATDLATASRTGLLELATGQWSDELCALHGVPKECLPRITNVDDDLGKINGVPVRASIVDQQAALFGHGCRNPGDCKITFGTGAFLLAVSGSERPPQSDLLPTVAWALQRNGATYAIEGGVYDAGSALEWARNIGLYSALEELGVFEGPSALSRGIIFVPALSGLAAPYWDRTAAPLFIGMDHATDRRDLVRAVLEGIAMLTVGLIEAASAVTDLGSGISIDGGLSQSPYFGQFLASASKRSITVPSMHELTALGLAEFCGLDVSAARAKHTRFEPDGSVTDEHHALFAKAVERARGWRS
ncbi:FGGY family carbohydrate kinase (plasmid) [Agrobacterium tumefaciens]|uniref:FGGY family carbohydrate kinase n=1 Tax=Agrobacterium tumefaciens TaxID=358 RepID=UPI000E0B492E|nr:FGGY family carbohydrate kinase [Agrobacterium tumefaciens]WQE43527.1 FGGY family carbohydrate kinase [Agrobacterium tumefaciens]